MEKKAEASRKKILDAALISFNSRGYDPVIEKEITQTVERAKGFVC